MPASGVVIVGFVGGVVSVALLASLGADTLLDASFAFAVTSPTGIGFVGVIVATPVASATSSPITCPSPSYNVTVEPGSAVTLIGSCVFALPASGVVIVGAFGLTTASLLLPDDKLYGVFTNSVPVAFFTSFLYVPSTITLALNRSPSDNSFL